MVQTFPRDGGRHYGTGTARYKPGQIFIRWMKIPAIGHHDESNPSVARQVIALQSVGRQANDCIRREAPRAEQFRIVKRA